ncbi:MAG: SpoIIE family protein phosphatase [Luteolibacter sp.]
MKLVSPGLRGKFVGALLIAAVLPLAVGLIFLETLGYRHILAERGKLHQMQAFTLVRALDQASKAQAGQFRSWLAADARIVDFVTDKNQSLMGQDPKAIAEETGRLDEAWELLPDDDPRLLALLQNTGSVELRKFQSHYPELAEIIVTDVNGRLVAATGKSTDVDQADESWWQQGKSLSKGSEWIDVLRFDASSKVFSEDVVLPLYDGDKFAGVVKMAVDVTSLFTHLGFDGEALGERWQIVLPDGRILASSKKGFISLWEKLDPDDLKMLKAKRKGWASMVNGEGESRMAGFVALGEGDGSPDSYVIFSSLSSDVVGPLRRTVVWLGLGGALLIGICSWAGFKHVDRKILQPLSALGQAARSISTSARLRHLGGKDEEEIQKSRVQAEADLEKIRAIHTGDEVEALAGDLAVMTSRVLRYHRELETEVEAKTALIREDLEMAREFQNALLPSVYPDVPPLAVTNPLRLKFAHFYQPASTVGGDFFDLIELDENRVGVLIADVMGHGARSALVTAILRALVRNHASIASSPNVFLSELNRHLHEMISRSGQSMFVTAFYIVLDTRQGLASWAVSGHPAPLRVRRGSGKGPEPLWFESPRQPALGLVPNFAYRSFESPLHAGDVFLLFTDGSVEAENPDGEAFGLKRLAASLDEALDGPMAAMPAKIVCDVTFFQKRKQYEDDVCLVAIEACGGTTADTW